MFLILSHNSEIGQFLSYIMFQVEHEEWFVAHKFYQEQFSSTLRSWAHDRQDLLIKVKVTFIDAWTAYEEATEKAKTRKKQEHICQELYKKVGPGQFFGISFEFSVEILQNNLAMWSWGVMHVERLQAHRYNSVFTSNTSNFCVQPPTGTCIP